MGLVLAAIPATRVKPMRTDKAIGDKMENKLAADSGVQAAKVNIVVNNSVFALTGEMKEQ